MSIHTVPLSRLSRVLTAVLIAALTFAGATAASEPAATSAGVVNINQADEATLQLLPRVGPALARRIVEHREANGAFKSAGDLVLVRGIGERTFEMLAPYVVVEGKTTLARKIRASELAPSDPEAS